MSLKEIKDKLEIGLKPDAPYRPANLPESEQPHPPHPPGTDPEEQDTHDPLNDGRSDKKPGDERSSG